MRLLFFFFLLFFLTFHSFDDGHAVLGYFGRSLGHRRWSCRDCWRGGRNWRWCRRLFRYSFISDYCFICCCWFGVDSRNVCYFFDRLFNDGFLFGFLDFLGGQDHLLFVVSFGYKKGGKKNKTKEGNLVFELSSTHTVHSTRNVYREEQGSRSDCIGGVCLLALQSAPATGGSPDAAYRGHWVNHIRCCCCCWCSNVTGYTETKEWRLALRHNKIVRAAVGSDIPSSRIRVLHCK